MQEATWDELDFGPCPMLVVSDEDEQDMAMEQQMDNEMAPDSEEVLSGSDGDW